MGKIIFLGLLLCVSTYAQELEPEKQQFQTDCLQCHIQHQIPNELIYRRYLMKYSTEEAMTVAIKKYLRNPKNEDSIMPPQFFLKFPRKDAITFDNALLMKNIQSFLDTYDVKKKLVLPQ